MLIKNPFNYIGGKDRLLKQIEDNLDKSKTEFIDLFCGSGVVGVNARNRYFPSVHLNDACWQVVRTIEYFRDNSTQLILDEIDAIIKDFELSKINKDGYLLARRCFNNEFKDDEVFNPAFFYALVTHSFNYSIMFNAKGEYNVPAGTNRSNFNDNLRNKLITFCDTLHEKHITTSCIRMNDLINTLTVSCHSDLSDYIVYADPPYFNSDDSYSRIYGLKWTEKEERALYLNLDMIAACGGSFLLSNTVENNGKTNEILKEWMKKYTVVEVDMSYKGCNYQRKNEGRTKEIMVKNY